MNQKFLNNYQGQNHDNFYESEIFESQVTPELISISKIGSLNFSVLKFGLSIHWEDVS